MANMQNSSVFSLGTVGLVICLSGMHETMICAESAHLKKKKIRVQEISYPRAVSSSLECGQHMPGSSEV